MWRWSKQRQIFLSALAVTWVLAQRGRTAPTRENTVGVSEEGQHLVPVDLKAASLHEKHNRRSVVANVFGVSVLRRRLAGSSHDGSLAGQDSRKLQASVPALSAQDSSLRPTWSPGSVRGRGGDLGLATLGNPHPWGAQRRLHDIASDIVDAPSARPSSPSKSVMTPVDVNANEVGPPLPARPAGSPQRRRPAANRIPPEPAASPPPSPTPPSTPDIESYYRDNVGPARLGPVRRTPARAPTRPHPANSWPPRRRLLPPPPVQPEPPPGRPPRRVKPPYPGLGGDDPGSPVPEPPPLLPPPPLPSTGGRWDSRNRHATQGVRLISPVRFQASCSACVAFAVLAAAETAYALATGTNAYELDFSEQRMFFCESDVSVEPPSCKLGWNVPDALAVLQQRGVYDECCYLYDVTRGNRTCSSKPRPDSCRGGRPGDDSGQLCGPRPGRWSVVSYEWESAEQANATLAKNLVRQLGSAVTCFKLYLNMYWHPGGTYRWDGESPWLGYHCAQLIGWNDRQGFWTFKSSWGVEVGNNGFFRIAYGEADVMAWGVYGVAWQPQD